MTIAKLQVQASLSPRSIIKEVMKTEHGLVKDLELVRGKGYYYLVGYLLSGQEPRHFVSSSFMAYRLNQWTLEFWVREIKDKIAEEREAARL